MEHFDVLVIGAGLSGIAAAYYLQSACPGRSFAVLEGRSDLGGTWDLFRYPGIRSDSDMHTLGFQFFPWNDPQAIADGPSIKAYLRETVGTFDLERHIRFDRRVKHASWSTADSRWTIRCRTAGGEVEELTCDFLWACTGYYRYEAGYTPDFEGTERFAGRLVHPQHWPEDLDYSGKRVVVIGSGATAVTLVPAMAERAGHVTMLQRSPTWVMSIPREDKLAQLFTRVGGRHVGGTLTRWKNVLRLMVFFQFSRRWPERARRMLLAEVREKLGPDFDVDTHFTPTYDPWDQRLCFVPDDDLFDVLKSGQASVVTDRIAHFTETGLALESGASLDADIVVTATGLDLVAFGGATLEVDGEPVNVGEKLMYKGTMLDDVPNAAISVGYTNAPWTLKCELIAQYVTRLLNHMERGGYTQCWPRRPEDVDEIPLIDFSSSYVQRAAHRLPKQGSRRPWRLYQNYFLDVLTLRHRRIGGRELEFR